MRIVVLADSDSYVKWGAALAGRLGPEWERELLVVASQFTVNESQLATALAGSGIADGERVAYRDVASEVARRRPDAVLVAAPGPVSMVLIRTVAEIEPRPVIVSGLPGISIPATRKALRFRLQSDLMVVHSRREIRDFGALSRERGWDHRLGLARLPFAQKRPAAGTDLVFAAQAVVPTERAHRREIAAILREAALARPERDVVVKLRSLPGERSTHPERDGYPELFAEIGSIPANLRFVGGSMARALDAAEGLVTVSSTAVLEAVARGIPVIAIDTFGVSPRLINPVFVGSGLFGGRSDVVARAFRHPDPEWLTDNYFHDEDAHEWSAMLVGLVAERRAGRLSPRAAVVGRGGSLRAAWDRKMAFGDADRSFAGYAALAVGLPARGMVRIARRVNDPRSRSTTVV